MAVFTTVPEISAKDFISRWPAGAFRSITPIASGIENTNYFVDTDTGRWVLTIFEKLTDKTLPFYLSLMEHLGEKGCAVARPLRTKNGDLFDHYDGKPAILTNRLPGEDGREVTAPTCASMGETLARMHLAVQDFKLWQENPRGLAWWIETIPRILTIVPADIRSGLAHELQAQIALQGGEAWKALPAGACHSDLFRNNAKVSDIGTGHERVTGVFDFFFAGCVPFIYDLAVTMNDWCTDMKTGEFIPEREKAFLDAYAFVRPLSGLEKQMWRGVLCAAAFRFWVSRLSDFYEPRDAALLKPHDPEEFRRILVNRQVCDLYWPEASTD